jgi:hypothetical protein
LTSLAKAIREESSEALPAIHLLLMADHFVSRTKRFEDSWEPLLKELATFSEGNVDSNLLPMILLPEDKPFIGLPIFCDNLKDNITTDEDEDDELVLLRNERIFRLAKVLEAADMLGHLDGKWYGGKTWQRVARQSRTMTLLAKQRLTNQVRALESCLELPPHLPWLVPDCDALLRRCEEVAEAIRAPSERRYLITLPILAELDWLKLTNPDARKLIRILSAAPPAVLRLQKPSERLRKHPALPPPKMTMSPRERHQRHFLEALAWLALNQSPGTTFTVLSDDQTVLRVAKNLLFNGNKQ